MIITIKKALHNFTWISLFQLIGFCLGQITKANMEWYYSITKSSLTPPNFVFSLTWIVLYVILALMGKFLWANRKEHKIKLILTLFVIQLILNWIWTPIFFSMHLTGLAAIIIIIIAIIIIYIIVKSWSDYQLLAYAMIPYFLWLTFAAYLNLVIWYEETIAVYQY
jgi:benzodiazapine receptor